MKCLCASVRRAGRLLTRYYEEELQSTDLTPAQFELLGTLSANASMPQSDLAESLGVDQTTLSRNLKVLIARKWVSRTASGEDRRQAAYTVSREGRAVWRRALPHWQRAQDRMQQILGNEWPSTWSMLERLTKAIPV